MRDESAPRRNHSRELLLFSSFLTHLIHFLITRKDEGKERQRKDSTYSLSREVREMMQPQLGLRRNGKEIPKKEG